MEPRDPTRTCATCQHTSFYHRESATNEEQFPCEWPKPYGDGEQLCHCENFKEYEKVNS